METTITAPEAPLKLKVRDERNTAYTDDLIIVDTEAKGRARQVAFVVNRGDKDAQRQLAKQFAASSEVVRAAQALLDRMDAITTAEFACGGERTEREALRAAIQKATG